MKTTEFHPTIEQFRWQAITSSGQKRRGKLIATSLNQALTHLSQQQLTVTKISARKLSWLELIEQRVTANDIRLLITQMATMLSSGLPVIQVVELTREQNKKAGMLILLEQLHQQITNGSGIAQAMALSHPGLKGTISELVAAGETSGQLTETFERLARYIDKQQHIREKVKKAAIYPSVVLVISLGLAYLMLTEIIPQFESMFNSLGATLPWFTQLILNLSHTLEALGIWLFIAIIITGIGIKRLYNCSQQCRYFICWLKISIPVIGPIAKKATIARFCQTLSATYRCGIPILEAIDTASRTTNDLLFQRTVSSLNHKIATGTPLFQALRQTEIFPELVIQLVMVGEESGNLERALEHIAARYEHEVYNSVDNLEKLLEPLVIAVLGVIVGGLVIAMYLPIFNLMSVLG